MSYSHYQDKSAFQRLPAGWSALPFAEVFDDVSSGNVKLDTGRYLPEGEFPVIDQGKALISGYTDDAASLIRTEPPFIIFGDHTRILKYYDAKFVLGADGVKVLKPKACGVNAKYLYYFLRGLRIPNTGYNRHFKYLKDAVIVIPPVAVQEQITDSLEAADRLVHKRKEAVAKLDELAMSAFMNLFGDPVANPHGYRVARLDEVCDVRDGTHDSPKYVQDGVPLVTSKNVVDGEIDFNGANLITEEDFREINRRSFVEPGDIIMPMIGTIGNPAIVSTDRKFAIKNVALIKFAGATEVSNLYIKTLLDSHYFVHLLSSRNRGGTQKFISLGDIRSFEIPVPPAEKLRKFADLMRGLEDQKVVMKRQLAELETNFEAVSRLAFSGQLQFR